MSFRRCGRAIRGGSCKSMQPDCSAIASSPAASRAESMNIARPIATPVRLTGPAALRWGLRLAREPLMATRQCFEAHGGFVVLADALPFVRPRSVALLGVPLVLTAGAAFHGELLSGPDTWRSLSVLSDRTGHADYRRVGD